VSTVLLFLLTASTAFTAQREARRSAPPGEGPITIQWVVSPGQKDPQGAIAMPREDMPVGAGHRTFFSQSMKTEVGFIVYNPPGYGTGTKRYPVLYWLHGRDGSEWKGLELATKLHHAIVKRKVPPMILVLANGGQRTFYCDSADGTILSETALIKELIPFIDQNYRTVASREGRALEGFSMGGFGALKTALKHPEMFCSLVAGGSALFDVETFSQTASFQRMFGLDGGYYKAFDPYELARNNAERIRRNLQIMLFLGNKDQLLEGNQRFHELLTELEIPHEYRVVNGLGHERLRLYDLLAETIFAFHWKAFAASEGGRSLKALTRKESIRLERLPEKAEEGLELYRFSDPTLRKIEGYIVKPEGKGPFPLVLVSHGGGRDAETFGIPYGSIFARNGFVGIACQYTHARHARRGGEPYKEGEGPGASRENIRRALETIRFAKTLDFVDGARIAMWGNSLGSFLTVGALASKDIAELVSVAAAISGGVLPPQMDEGLREGETIQRAAISAEEAERIRTPLLIMHGREDPLCPVASAIALKEALDGAGTPARLVILDGVGHGVKDQERTFGEVIAFFRKYLGLQQR
jgi:enterochelin esterase-like enzyme/dienelactone hydrolase